MMKHNQKSYLMSLIIMYNMKTWYGRFERITFFSEIHIIIIIIIIIIKN